VRSRDGNAFPKLGSNRVPKRIEEGGPNLIGRLMIAAEKARSYSHFH
jgi:hypothetical protein